MYQIREYKKATQCEHRGRLRACHRPLLGQCQYCARGFCDRHGEQFGDREEVCLRPACRAKRADLAAHLEFRARAHSRNGESCCGEPDCDVTPAQDCKRCKAHYCARHLREHMLTVESGGAQEAQVLRLCVHCVERIAIWERA